MAIMKAFSSRGVFMGKLRHGADLLEEITGICLAENIRMARIEAIGAVEKARLAYYDQAARKYDYLAFDRPLEITNMIGNVSVMDGRTLVHAHLTLTDHKGNAYGGHLASGTIIFACECIIEAFDGPILERGQDDETGLSLWMMKE